MLKAAKISEYLSTYEIEWKIAMPSGWPPEDIEIPFEHKLYRLTHDKNGSLTEEDLITYSELEPNKDWADNYFQSFGLSLITKISEARKKLLLPRIRKQNLKGITEINLNPTDGVVKQTGRKDHYTWWQTKSFDISNHNPVESWETWN